MKKTKIKQSGMTGFLRWVLRILLYGWVVTVLYPLVWMVATALKSSQEFMAGNVWQWPKVMYFQNFATAWKDANMSSYTWNTVFVSAITVFLFIFMLTTTTYILGTYEFKFVKAIEKYYWFSMMIPTALLLVPMYFQVADIGAGIQSVLRVILNNPDLTINFTDNKLTLSIIYAGQSLPGAVFLVTGFVKGINKSFLEAARMDGAGEWYVFSKIVLPFIKPIALYECLTKFMGTWNEYLTALTFLDSESNYTLSVGIQKLITKFTYESDYGAIFAGLLISLIPTIILYCMFQNVLQNGMQVSDGVK